ncbi:hypothetical protein WN944_022270 [Citrus x changshan-huyou]|uniref:NB-ARC domain-containing protein n=1 Tax=Citrus x changshan-huyou TaxID=2935761 RepID=A0AAP0MYB2_9ROSI
MKVGYVSELEDKLIALQNELQNLTEVRNDVMRRVVVAEQHYMMKRKAQVQGWLSGVEAVEAEVGELQEVKSQEIEKLCLGGYCSKSCKSSYKFGKEVARKLQAVISLKGEGDFKDVAETVPEDPVDEMPLERTIVGQQATFQKVLNCLAENAIIGLYGSGGVGKTTLLKQINNNFCYGGHNFDIVIWVVVSKELKLERIQEDIGKKIRLPTDSWKNRSIENEARDIYNILSKKKFLLLLDDMWESIDLTKVGVPLSNQKTESKIVFTTRFEEVCGKMEAQKKIKVECLGLEEAWRLFQMKVGEDTLDSHPDISKLAKTMAKECAGLLLALITVGQAMTCKKTPEEWRDAIEMLTRSTAEFSDYKIDKRNLIEYWIDEGFLDEYGGSRAVNRGYTIIGDLIRACLLENEQGNCVKTHDVVRDMALWIACEIEKEKQNFLVLAGAGLTEAPMVES